MAEDIEMNGFYDFDPSAGLICICCGIPVSTPSKSSYEYAIGHHESTVKIHLQSGQRETTKNQRMIIASRFMKYMEECVDSVQRCLPCITTANERFLSFVGTSQAYDYCSECNVMTTDKGIHNMKKCLSLGHFKDTKDGVKNKYWTKMNPKVIMVETFSINSSKQYIHRHFQELWEKGNVSIGGIEGVQHDELEPNVFAELLQQQSDIFNTERRNQTIQQIDNKLTPNLFVTSLQWDIALSGCSFQILEGLKNADRFGKYENGINMVLNHISDTLWYALKCSEKLQSSHPVLRAIGTRNGGESDALFSLSHEQSTWKAYFNHIAKISLILFRLNDSSNTFHESTLPYVTFTNEQKDLMSACISYSIVPPKNEVETQICQETHLNFLFSLIVC